MSFYDDTCVMDSTTAKRYRRFSDTTVATAKLYRSPLHTPEFSPSPPMSSSACEEPPPSMRSPDGVSWKDVRDCFVRAYKPENAPQHRERFLALWTACVLRDQPRRRSCVFV